MRKPGVFSKSVAGHCFIALNQHLSLKVTSALKSFHPKGAYVLKVGSLEVFFIKF